MSRLPPRLQLFGKRPSREAAEKTPVVLIPGGKKMKGFKKIWDDSAERFDFHINMKFKGEKGYQIIRCSSHWNALWLQEVSLLLLKTPHSFTDILSKSNIDTLFATGMIDSYMDYYDKLSLFTRSSNYLAETNIQTAAMRNFLMLHPPQIDLELHRDLFLEKLREIDVPFHKPLDVKHFSKSDTAEGINFRDSEPTSYGAVNSGNLGPLTLPTPYLLQGNGSDYGRTQSITVPPILHVTKPTSSTSGYSGSGNPPYPPSGYQTCSSTHSSGTTTSGSRSSNDSFIHEVPATKHRKLQGCGESTHTLGSNMHAMTIDHGYSGMAGSTNITCMSMDTTHHFPPVHDPHPAGPTLPTFTSETITSTSTSSCADNCSGSGPGSGSFMEIDDDWDFNGFEDVFGVEGMEGVDPTISFF